MAPNLSAGIAHRQRCGDDKTRAAPDNLGAGLEAGLVAILAGRAPVTFDLTERKRHTITAGLSYSTNLGFGINSSWTNRNLWHRAEKLSANADITLSRIPLGSSHIGANRNSS